MKLRHLPVRLATGAFILDSGLSVRDADEQTAAALHGMAKQAYPFLGKLEPKQFAKLLSTAEIGLGAALLLPVVPTAWAALGLAAFSGGLVGLYLRTPGTRRGDGVRPTQEGIPLAKDSWLLGIALSLLVDAAGERCRKARAAKAVTD